MIGVILVCLSITKVILKHTSIAPIILTLTLKNVNLVYII